MNQRTMMGAVFIFVGVALVYAAATGNLQSAWHGLKGDCKGAASAPPSGADVTSGPTQGNAAGQAGRAKASVGGDGYGFVGTDGRVWVGNAGSLY